MATIWSDRNLSSDVTGNWQLGNVTLKCTPASTRGQRVLAKSDLKKNWVLANFWAYFRRVYARLLVSRDEFTGTRDLVRASLIPHVAMNRGLVPQRVLQHSTGQLT